MFLVCDQQVLGSVSLSLVVTVFVDFVVGWVAFWFIVYLLLLLRLPTLSVCFIGRGVILIDHQGPGLGLGVIS